MKYLCLFAGKSKNNMNSLSSAEFAESVVKVKLVPTRYIFMENKKNINTV